MKKNTGLLLCNLLTKSAGYRRVNLSSFSSDSRRIRVVEKSVDNGVLFVDKLNTVEYVYTFSQFLTGLSTAVKLYIINFNKLITHYQQTLLLVL